jgi:hypothetical protein
MRCLFCKEDSRASRSVEHILPESIGNTTLILPPGVVCDRCNNYFARKVERPFFDLPAIRQLRFHQRVRSKRGRVPPLEGTWEDAPAVMEWNLTGSIAGSITLPPDAAQRLVDSKGGTIWMPADDSLPDGPAVSRFLAKAALETFAHRIVEHAEGLEYLVDHQGFDDIRNHARRGSTPNWPFHCRRLYDANRHFTDGTGKEVQTVHESDILVIPLSRQTNDAVSGIWYYVVALFGLEFSINVGSQEIDRYRRWLVEHDDISPLYWGKNA